MVRVKISTRRYSKVLRCFRLLLAYAKWIKNSKMRRMCKFCAIIYEKYHKTLCVMKHQHVGFKHSFSPLVGNCFGVEMYARTSGWGVIAIFSLSKKIFINSGEGEKEKVLRFPSCGCIKWKEKFSPVVCFFPAGSLNLFLFIHFRRFW